VDAEAGAEADTDADADLPPPKSEVQGEKYGLLMFHVLATMSKGDIEMGDSIVLRITSDVLDGRGYLKVKSQAFVAEALLVIRKAAN